MSRNEGSTVRSELGFGLWSAVFFCLCVSVFFFGTSAALAWHSLTTGGQCKQTQTSCRTTIGNAGGADACCDPLSSGLATCAAQNECVGGNPYKWPALPVGWYLNLNNMPGQGGYQGKTGTTIEATLKAAWDAWKQPSCTDFAHNYLGQTTTKGNPSDRRLVCWLPSSADWSAMRLPSSVLAVTQPAVSSNGSLIDADIAFNPLPSGRLWGMTPNVQANEMDFADVAAHEIGHALGFGHTAPRSSLMYFSVRGVGPLFNGITSDEESGVCTIYPTTGCTSAAQCGTCRDCVGGKCGPKTFPIPPQNCKPCRQDADCGGGACAQVDGRSRCLLRCDAAGCCPSGTKCQSSGASMLCMPDTNKCPDAPCATTNECGSNETCQNGRCQKMCQSDADCAAGFVCKNQACIEAQPANLGQPCNANIPCVAGTICQNTSKGQICTVACGTGTGGFPNGAPGSSCSSCAAGTSCIDNVGLSACLRSCSSNSTCAAAAGGLCGRINSGTPFCLCRGDTDCASGYNCNKEVLGNLGLGACAQRGGGTCPTGYACDGNFCIPSGGAVCGNGSCDGNEDCSSCPKDCPCPSGQQCQGGICITPSTCGNGACDASENCATCAQDCACPPTQICNAGKCEENKPQCGNGICDNNETCDACKADCLCPEGLACNNGLCKPLANCGDGRCAEGEACDSCPQDCRCPQGQVCLDSLCQASSPEGNASTESTSENSGENTSVREEGGSSTESRPPDGSRPPDAGPLDGDLTERAAGAFGGPCRSDGSCDGNAICVQQPDSTKVCLVPNGSEFKPRAFGCSCQSVLSQESLGLAFWLLGWLCWGVWRRRRNAHRIDRVSWVS
ncbi:matrixin family metalloprotease [Myxococcota bacterium]|nr:matrixin family metalloprotease [Myxococcota bacterium]